MEHDCISHVEVIDSRQGQLEAVKTTTVDAATVVTQTVCASGEPFVHLQPDRYFCKVDEDKKPECKDK